MGLQAGKADLASILIAYKKAVNSLDGQTTGLILKTYPVRGASRPIGLRFNQPLEPFFERNYDVAPVAAAANRNRWQEFNLHKFHLFI